MSAVEPLSFLDHLWLARMPLLRGLGFTVTISFLAIVAGSLLGIVVLPDPLEPITQTTSPLSMSQSTPLRTSVAP